MTATLHTSIEALAFDERGAPRSEAELRRIMSTLPVEDLARLELGARYAWDLWARPKQREPEPPWRWWFLLAGRGFGKTRTAAEATIERIRTGRAKRIGLVGPTKQIVREVMIEGPDGIIARSPPWFTPRYEPSKTRITWPGGAIGTTLSADEPDSMRGPSFDWVWAEEIASWRYAESFWEGAELCLRKGAAQGIITGTPKPLPLIIDLVRGRKGADGKRIPREDLVVVSGSTFENRPNLAKGYMEALMSQYEGTNLGRQELHAEILDGLQGALWNYEIIERARVDASPDLAVLVVAIDPTTSSTGSGDECGIILGGRGADGHAYIVDDVTMRGTPDAWAREAVRAYHHHKADRITFEGNWGGRQAVLSTIGTVDSRVPLKEVVATRGKAIRAEPVSALYEQGKVHHVGVFPRLEDELCAWRPGATGRQDPRLERSPNRLDALVWLVTDLLLEGEDDGPSVYESRGLTIL